MFGWLSGADEGRTLRYATIGSAAATLMALLVGAGAERIAGSSDRSLLALFGAGEAAKAFPAKFNAIDYATTGSTVGKSQLVVIGPCGADQK